MIRKDLDDMACLSKVVSILRKSVDNSVEFFVVYIPIFLCGVEFVME